MKSRNELSVFLNVQIKVNEIKALIALKFIKDIRHNIFKILSENQTYSNNLQCDKRESVMI